MKTLNNKQQQSDMGINPFAVELLAESFAKNREKFTDSVCVIGYGKDKKPVYITISSVVPVGCEETK